MLVVKYFNNKYTQFTNISITIIFWYENMWLENYIFPVNIVIFKKLLRLVIYELLRLL
jgi:hypothetical protein